MSSHNSPEGSAGSSPGGADAAQQVPPVSLAEMISRHVALTWPEAVALIGEACSLAVQAAPNATHIPDAGRLLVFADGSIRVGPWRGEMDIPSTARALHDLLAGAEPPTPLRLFVGHAISSGKYTAVGEFAEALAYYERPGRTELVQSAFQRFLLTPPDMPAPAGAAPPEPVVQQPPPEDERARARSRKAIGRMLIASVFLLVIVTGAAVVVRLLPRTETGGLPSLKTVTDQATVQVAQLRSKLRDLVVPLGINLPGPATASVTQDAPVDRPAPRSAAPARAAAAVAPAPEPVAAPARPAAIAPGPSPEEVARLAEQSLPPAPQEEAVLPIVEDMSIYSSESSGVSPPVPVSPRVLPSPLGLSASQAQNQMELIIGMDGSVEQVRMLTPIKRLPDVMLLSGAKSWLFKPAMKDGRPVRYRLPLTWAVSPR